MGFFGPSKKTYVSSTVYNLAGDEEERPQYLNSLIFQNILSRNNKRSVAEALNSGYLNGPGIGFRSFFRWADIHYDDIGMPTGVLSAASTLDLVVVADYVPHAVDETPWVQDGNLDDADYGRWIEQWFLDNYPDQYSTDWTADINEVTHEITITLVDTSTHSFIPSDFNPRGRYIYAYYSLQKGAEVQPLVVGTTYYTAFPSISGYTLINTFTESRNWTLTTTTTVDKTYSDATPPTSNTTTGTSSGPYTYEDKTYSKTEYKGTITGINGIYQREILLHLITDSKRITNAPTVVVTTITTGGVTETTTTTTTTQSVVADNHHHTDYQDTYVKSWGPVRLFIYRIGSGEPELDASVSVIEEYGKFFPFIPVRINNEFLSETFYPDAYEDAKKAYKKATKRKLDDLIETISDNPDLDDIDFTYIIYGVSLNVKEDSCKKYLYQFFTKLMNSQVGGPSIYTDWLLERDGITNSSEAWTTWRNAQSDPLDPLYGTPEPSTSSVRNPTLTENLIEVGNDPIVLDTGYNMRMIWAYITSGAGVGLGKPGAKKGDLWFEYLGEDEFFNTVVTQAGILSGVRNEKLRLYWQDENDSYIFLDTVGLRHYNHVYNGKYIDTKASDAFYDDEESGFIVPLHYETFKNMSLVDSTQMSTACVFLVFNSYQIVKTRWYERGIFKIFLIVAIVIVSAVFTGGGGIGILGANVAIGSSFGFSGLTAAIVGAVVNALAAIALTTILDTLATTLFGDQIGAIVSAVLSFLVMQSITAFQNTGSFALSWGDLMKADNLLMIMDAVGKGYQAYVQGNMVKMAGELKDYTDQADDDLERIRQEYYDEFGYGIDIVNPLTLLDSAQPIIESGDTFLTRTLMTGSDVADMSLSMITDFSELTLKLPNAYT